MTNVTIDGQEFDSSMTVEELLKILGTAVFLRLNTNKYKELKQ